LPVAFSIITVAKSKCLVCRRRCVRTFGLSIVGAIGLLSLALLPASALDQVRLAQNQSPISGVSIIAKAKGLFEANSLDVVVANFTTGKQCLDTVVGGGAEFATTAESPTTAAAMAKTPIAFLARTEYSDLKTLVAVAARIKTPADLKGKRIAYTAGTGSEVYTWTLLRSANLGTNDVNLVNLRPQEMAPALAAGSIDAYNTWEPHIINGRKALGEKVVQLDTKGVYSETFNIVVMRDFAEKNPKVVRAFLKSLIDAEAWMNANQEEAITIVAEFVRMKRDDLVPIWDDFKFGVVLDQKVMDILKAHATWRLATGNAPPNAAMPDFTSVVLAEPLRDVAPDRVRLP
jgi:ABC-type nitrate/sulfonate/bicarbonate transport system substrate-binding protein